MSEQRFARAEWWLDQTAASLIVGVVCGVLGYFYETAFYVACVVLGLSVLCSTIVNRHLDGA